MSEDPPLVAVAIDPRVAEEHPGLLVWTVTVDARTGRTPRELRERLRLLADRFRGPEAVAMRSRPVPWAYRVLYRHLGIDPDVTRTPVEELAVERTRLTPGVIELTVRNDGPDAVTIAQAVVNDAFVQFSGAEAPIASMMSTSGTSPRTHAGKRAVKPSSTVAARPSITLPRRIPASRAR